MTDLLMNEATFDTSSEGVLMARSSYKARITWTEEETTIVIDELIRQQDIDPKLSFTGALHHAQMKLPKERRRVGNGFHQPLKELMKLRKAGQPFPRKRGWDGAETKVQLRRDFNHAKWAEESKPKVEPKAEKPTPQPSVILEGSAEQKLAQALRNFARENAPPSVDLTAAVAKIEEAVLCAGSLADERYNELKSKVDAMMSLLQQIAGDLQSPIEMVVRRRPQALRYEVIEQEQTPAPAPVAAPAPMNGVSGPKPLDVVMQNESGVADPLEDHEPGDVNGNLVTGPTRVGRMRVVLYGVRPDHQAKIKQEFGPKVKIEFSSAATQKDIQPVGYSKAFILGSLLPKWVAHEVTKVMPEQDVHVVYGNADQLRAKMRAVLTGNAPMSH